jgi:ABC-type iron transport system FetAB permease component
MTAIRYQIVVVFMLAVATALGHCCSCGWRWRGI